MYLQRSSVNGLAPRDAVVKVGQAIVLNLSRKCQAFESSSQATIPSCGVPWPHFLIVSTTLRLQLKFACQA